MNSRTPLSIAHQWVDMLAGGKLDQWGELADASLSMYTPFSPPGMFANMQGSAACLGAVTAFSAAWERFAWFEVEAHQTDDPELVFGTAKSDGVTKSGAHYSNQYCFIVRVRNGKILDYTEYFNPMPVVAAFGGSA